MGVPPEKVIEFSGEKGFLFNGETKTGVVFHLLGALQEFGKCGITAVGNSEDQAKQLYDQTFDLLKSTDLQ